MPETLPASLVLSAGQCRAARALLGWSAQDLAVKARVTPDWLAAFERGGETVDDLDPSEAERVLRALEDAGVELLASGQASTGGGPGLRIRQQGGYIPAESLSSANDG
ncbi:helix-turn-helix transcriptional regulator [Ancylobacter dichloromethanicus]|uniref:Transcriptional regulator n=1 Tax=Ancylobacter dichloromethanicus TaxID=518825 RepID=A0A9W6JCJ5_9HYPH|nr:helix-turn-helix transcriptional regulator [Ancylobacter dichloromethanicus]MBS7556678.1 helix-turn-helix transcriptional regulator [Ancylobacter dichloromethanicus]GLK73529.1 transcriptional regulator [Ancylobacter dichloromethanicus]